MKFNCGPTKAEREAARKQREAEKKACEKAKVMARREWHPVFALVPRQVASHDCRWLETIEHRAVQTGLSYGSLGCPLLYMHPQPVYGWEYRELVWQ